MITQLFKWYSENILLNLLKVMVSLWWLMAASMKDSSLTGKSRGMDSAAGPVQGMNILDSLLKVNWMAME